MFGCRSESEGSKVGQDEHDDWVMIGILIIPIQKLKPMAIGFSFSGSIMSLRSTAMVRQMTRLVSTSEMPNISFKDLTVVIELYA